MRKYNENKVLRKRLRAIQKKAIEKGLQEAQLKQFDYICDFYINVGSEKQNRKLFALILFSFLLLVISVNFVNNILSARCLLPSNYFVWEGTRPLADCSYCENVTEPIVLSNITRQEFTVRL